MTTIAPYYNSYIRDRYVCMWSVLTFSDNRWIEFIDEKRNCSHKSMSNIACYHTVWIAFLAAVTVGFINIGIACSLTAPMEPAMCKFPYKSFAVILNGDTFYSIEIAMT